jgi:hypothetical protein
VAVAIGTVTTGALAAGSGSSLTFSFTSTSQPLYVVVPFWQSTKTLNSVTWAGSGSAVNLTRVAQSAASNGDDRVEIWRLLNPTAATANIVLTFSGLGPAGTVPARPPAISPSWGWWAAAAPRSRRPTPAAPD